jgi:hypothetical protein
MGPIINAVAKLGRPIQPMYSARRLSPQDRSMSFLRELWAFLRVRKKIWLLPIIVVMVLLGTLLILAQGSVLAPLIYTLF